MAERLTRPLLAHPIDGDAPTLSRGSVGLTPAHVEFIKLLAVVAVEQFLGEGDAQPVPGGEK